MLRHFRHFARRGLIAGALAIALATTGISSPASAYDMANDANWQAMQYAVDRTGNLFYNCRGVMELRVESQTSAGYTRVEGVQYSDGEGFVYMSVAHQKSTDGVNWTKASDPAAGLVNGELFYTGRKYIWHVEGAKWRGHKLSDVLSGLDAPAGAYVETLKPPAEMEPTAPLDVCDANAAMWDVAIASVEAAGLNPDSFTSGPEVSTNPYDSFDTDYLIVEESPAGSASVKLTVSSWGGYAKSITLTADTDTASVTTTLKFWMHGSFAVPTVPKENVYAEWQLAQGVTVTTLRGRVSPWATKVGAAATKAAAKLKGKAKNKVTQAIIRASAKSVITKKSNIAVSNIAGGVELTASANNFTGSVCVRAVKGKVVKKVC